MHWPCSVSLRGLRGDVVGPLVHASAPSGRFGREEIDQSLLRRQAARHIGFGPIDEILAFHERFPDSRGTVVREREYAPAVLGKHSVIHRSGMSFEDTKWLALNVPHPCSAIGGGGQHATSTWRK